MDKDKYVKFQNHHNIIVNHTFFFRGQEKHINASLVLISYNSPLTLLFSSVTTEMVILSWCEQLPPRHYNYSMVLPYPGHKIKKKLGCSKFLQNLKTLSR